MDPTRYAHRLGGGHRNRRVWILTVDNTSAGRVVTLTAGTWVLEGSAIQVYYCTRVATNDTGSLHIDESAPAAGDFAAAVQGTPIAGKAYGTGKLAEDNGSSTGSTRGAPEVPTDISREVVFTVAPGSFLNLYVKAASATTCKLRGPIT
jgi:hypothetical protein